MLRRILAAFALLTGLVATGVPAEARMLSVVSQQMEAGSQSKQAGPQAPCTLPARRGGLTGKVDPPVSCRVRRTVVIYLPTVQFGPDRALE